MKHVFIGGFRSFGWSLVGLITVVVGMGQASALPAFARKYQANCALCHTNEPRLTPFGQQFKENGYQMPGSSDGGTTAKHIFDGAQGPVTVDDVSKIMAVRIRADIQRPSFSQETDAMREDGVRSQVDVVVPKIVNLFFAGTAKENLSYYTEVEYNGTEPEASLKFERAYLLFNNLGGQSIANVQVGVFDPSGLFAFPTHRQQLNPIFPEADTTSFPPTINRVPIVPLAFASKMYGLTQGVAYNGQDGYAILPFQPYLYNAPAQTGLAVHGRPGGLGSNFLYQLGVAVNDKANIDGTKENRYDFYVMGRYDWTTDGGKVMQVSAFYYQAPDAAIPTLNMSGTLLYADKATDIIRAGIGARAQWDKWDIYGAYVTDSIDKPTWNNSGNAMAANSVWEDSGSGLSLEADYRMTEKWMLGMRYDRMSPGGLKQLPVGSTDQLNINASFLSAIAKYYTSPNLGLYVRVHFNLESSAKNPIGGSVDEHPATNLENMLTAGVDMAF